MNECLKSTTTTATTTINMGIVGGKFKGKIPIFESLKNKFIFNFSKTETFLKPIKIVLKDMLEK